MAYVDNPDFSFKELSEIVRYDPGITMNVLKLVNSAAFCGDQRLDSLQQAFVRLGARHVFKIIMAQGFASHLTTPVDGYELAPRGLLIHSVGVALSAETLAIKLGRHSTQLLFTAGLLHDMGKVVLGPFVFECRPEFEALLRDTDGPFDSLEQEVLGVTHAEAGAWLMELWSFPPELVSLVLMHHHPPTAGDSRDAALMLHLADTLVYSQGIGDGIDGFRYEVDEDAAGVLGLRSRDIEQVASSTLDRMREWEKSL